MPNLNLDLFWAAWGSGCVPERPPPDSPPPGIRSLSFSVEDDELTVIDKPPDSKAVRMPRTIMSGPKSGREFEFRTPRVTLTPKRTNFSEPTPSFSPALSIDVGRLSDPAWEKRHEAVASLGSCFLGRHPGEFNQEAAHVIIPALRAAMRDERWEVRAQAATSLSNLGPEAVWHAVPVLWETCSDPEEPVRRAALQALISHGQEAPPQHLQQPRLRSRPWQEPPSLKAVREDPQEDCQSEFSFIQEDLSTTAHSGESSRQSSHISTRDNVSDCYPSTTSEFTISIWKPQGSELGLDVDCTQTGCLKVLSVRPGIINDWNKNQASWAVEPGDSIVEVNGKGGCGQELLERLRKESRLEVTVQRHVRNSKDRCEI